MPGTGPGSRMILAPAACICSADSYTSCTGIARGQAPMGCGQAPCKPSKGRALCASCTRAPAPASCRQEVGPETAKASKEASVPLKRLKAPPRHPPTHPRAHCHLDVCPRQLNRLAARGGELERRGRAFWPIANHCRPGIRPQHLHAQHIPVERHRPCQVRHAQRHLRSVAGGEHKAPGA